MRAWKKAIIFLASYHLLFAFVALAQGHSVTVTWTASTDAGTLPIAYNIYRGTTKGGEGTTPIATGVTGTTYADANVAAGDVWYYQVEAYRTDTGVKSVKAESNGCSVPLSPAGNVSCSAK